MSILEDIYILPNLYCMATENAQINILLQKLEMLLIKQNSFAKEINVLKQDIYDLINSQQKSTVEVKPIIEQKKAEPIIIPKPKPIIPVTTTNSFRTPTLQRVNTTSKSSIEKFIGENLISKIGIIITVIGVAIGAKYSIEHELISPLTRIILGYTMGFALLAIGYLLRKKYTNYSAVLVSGAMAILYFITFSAYNFYHLIPLNFTFGLMVLFTVFTVYAALSFNNQIIALFGLAGAYAIPFLLSDGSGKVVILFSYMAIINIGILAIAVKKYWKLLYYVSFGLTWLIFSFWYITQYDSDKHFTIALFFAIVFFTIFYIIFLAYKLVKKEIFNGSDIVLVLLNSFIFYTLGYFILTTQYHNVAVVGFFTFCNAVWHYMVSTYIYKQKLADRNLFFLIAGLVLVFITITFPVLLDGNWVTLFWACEAALLYWIGTTQKVPIYEKLSYPLMLLAFISLLQDWLVRYEENYTEQSLSNFTPIFNVHFVTGLLFIGAFTIINYLKRKHPDSPVFNTEKVLAIVINFALPSILLISIYYTFELEIDTYFNQKYNTAVNLGAGRFELIAQAENLLHYKSIWVMNYAMLFMCILSYTNYQFIKNKNLGVVTLSLSTLFILLFLGKSLPDLNFLKQNYLHLQGGNAGMILIRYKSYAILAALFYTLRKQAWQELMQFLGTGVKIAIECLFYVTILLITTKELSMYLQLAQFHHFNNLGVSILMGVYAMLLIFLGMAKSKRYLRIMGFVIFAITLLKLFLYDIDNLDTISKTIVFVSLGVLLLLISFSYNKYKNLIFGNDDQK